MDDNDNLIGLAGDWHGAYTWTRHALHTFGQAGIKEIYHLGDFSLGWPGKWPDLINICESICKQYDMYLYITPGNHENWEWIDSRAYNEHGEHYMTPHTVILQRNWRYERTYRDADGNMKSRKILSLGGAASVDFDMRREGIDWFPGEAYTLRDVMRAAREGHADIMLCHDAPDGGTDKVQAILDMPPAQSIFSRKALAYAKQQRELLNMAIYGCTDLDGEELPGVKPKVFAHGHMHALDTKQTDDTLFLSLGCNNQDGNLMTLDLETLKHADLPIIQWATEIKEIEKKLKEADGERRRLSGQSDI